jgi:hypothetical protein
MMDPPGSRFWKSTLELFEKNLLGDGLISPHDLSLVRHCQDVDEAVGELTHFYSNYDSSRFLRDQYLIRVRRPVTDALLSKLNEEFGDVLSEGRFARLEGTDEDDNKDPSLSRIVFHFDKSGYARLRQMINTLNNAY